MDKPRKKVFVCSPFRPLSNDPQTREAEKEDNLRRARQGCRMVSDLGYIPIAPHLYFPQFLDDGTEEERAIGIEMGLALLEKCDELWLFGDRITEGMAREIGRAAEQKIPIIIVHSLDLSDEDVSELLDSIHEMRAFGVKPPYRCNSTDRK